MKKLLLLSIAVLATCTAAIGQEPNERESYRRSSLCLIMLTHNGKKYAEDMQRVFRNFPLPARYNEHNIADLRVINVSKKMSQPDIDKLVRSHNVAQRMVSRWFNRTEWDGAMNMDLIHERGGYGAFYSDYLRSKSNILGSALLRDEGIELLQSTFVLVCDMDYIDRSKGSSIFAGVLAGLAAVADVAGEVQRDRGNYNTANSWQAASSLGNAASAVVADIGGFRVKMNAYLYRLKWDDDLTQNMYGNFWIDENTKPEEVEARKQRYENSSDAFQLEFIGRYTESSSKTILKSWKNEDEVILDVCHRCVKKGMTELAKQFPVFRPRTPFYFEGDNMYAHIGLKEDVVQGKRYEILQPYKDKKGQICYKHVGRAEAGTPWDNMDVRFDQYFDPEWKGTQFFNAHCTGDIRMAGLQLREM